MKYRNTKTNTVTEFSCEIRGGNWVPLEKKKKKSPTSNKKKVSKKGDM